MGAGVQHVHGIDYFYYSVSLGFVKGQKAIDKIKNKLKVERAKLNVTQAEAAEKLQVSRQTIYAIELGKYNLSTVLALKMAEVFAVSVNVLFELEEKDRK